MGSCAGTIIEIDMIMAMIAGGISLSQNALEHCITVA